MQHATAWRKSFETFLSSQEDYRAVWPGSEEYNRERVIFNRMHDRFPAVILKTGCPETISTVVRFANKNGIALTIRGGGHHIAGLAAADSAIMIDCSDSREVSFDYSSGIVSVSPGARLKDLDTLLVPKGLVVPTGTVSNTGIAGLTLGGGIGWLSGCFGPTCDHLIGADVVLADGTISKVYESTDPELLWALRGGGGGNFGVVTKFYFKPQKLGKITAGNLVSGGQDIPEILNRFIDWLTHKCPRELTTAPLLRHRDGRLVLEVGYCLVGHTTEAMIEMYDILQIKTPHLPVKDFTIFQRMFDGDFEAPRRGYWKSTYIPTLRSDEIDFLTLEYMRSSKKENITITIEHLGGAFEERDVKKSAFPLKGRLFGILISGRWCHTKDDRVHIECIRNIANTIGRSSKVFEYYNYSQDRMGSMTQFYPDNVISRLKRIKKRVDPNNLFCNNPNIFS
ncbi:MAG: FAD-binding oxidoreductase [Paracoccaceae bacterium]|nr:FAD-binding oxidoreductase [Paracoccaceae bacterium]MDE2674109.1 FAD-binding oxidoreductase [Paracoccaceae bacterium]